MSRRRSVLTAAAGALTVAAAVPALAGAVVPVPVTTSTTVGQRTLGLTDAAGVALNSGNGLALRAGTASTVIASVKDQSYSTSGFQVTAVMSNLYQTASGGGYDFASAAVPSSAIAVSQPTNPLNLLDVKATTQPVFTLTGNLTSALGPVNLLLGGQNVSAVSVPVTGSLQELVVAAGNTTNTLLNRLPLGINGGTASAFTNPATLGAGDPATGSSPTTVPLITGTNRNTLATPALLTQLVAQVDAVNPGPLTLSELVSAGVLSQADVLSSVANQLSVPVSALTPLVGPILGALSPALTSLTGGAVNISGTYSGNNQVTVTPPPGTPAGTFKGLLTVTLVDVA